MIVTHHLVHPTVERLAVSHIGARGKCQSGARHEFAISSAPRRRGPGLTASEGGSDIASTQQRRGAASGGRNDPTRAPFGQCRDRV